MQRSDNPQSDKRDLRRHQTAPGSTHWDTPHSMSTTTNDRLAGTWTLDSFHSTATFNVYYLASPFRAEFERFSADLVDGNLTGSVEASSINIKDDYFRSQVLGSDFFDVEHSPEIS